MEHKKFPPFKMGESQKVLPYFFFGGGAAKSFGHAIFSFCSPPSPRGVGKGGSRGSDDPPFLGANFIHFLCKVLVTRSVRKTPLKT